MRFGPASSPDRPRHFRAPARRRAGTRPGNHPLVSIAATTPESDFTPNGSQAVRVQIVNGRWCARPAPDCAEKRIHWTIFVSRLSPLSTGRNKAHSTSACACGAPRQILDAEPGKRCREAAFSVCQGRKHDLVEDTGILHIPVAVIDGAGHA